MVTGTDDDGNLIIDQDKRAIRLDVIGDKWTDRDTAFDELLVVHQDCGDDCGSCGTNWSKLLLMNGIIMILVALNQACIMIGRHKAFFYLIGAYCGAIICLLHVAALVITVIFRFNTPGRICSLSTLPTNYYSSKAGEFNDMWTYSKDGTLILSLWIVQILGMPLCCIMAYI